MVRVTSTGLATNEQQIKTGHASCSGDVHHQSKKQIKSTTVVQLLALAPYSDDAQLVMYCITT